MIRWTKARKILPLHLAGALGTPARLLRRPAPCYPCHRFDGPIGHPCLDVAPGLVVAAIAALAPATAAARGGG